MRALTDLLLPLTSYGVLVLLALVMEVCHLAFGWFATADKRRYATDDRETLLEKREWAEEDYNKNRLDPYVRTALGLFFFTFTAVVKSAAAFFDCVLVDNVSVVRTMPALTCDSLKYSAARHVNPFCCSNVCMCGGFDAATGVLLFRGFAHLGPRPS